jgi:hypothetical protein
LLISIHVVFDYFEDQGIPISLEEVADYMRPYWRAIHDGDTVFKEEDLRKFILYKTFTNGVGL